MGRKCSRRRKRGRRAKPPVQEEERAPDRGSAQQREMEVLCVVAGWLGPRELWGLCRDIEAASRPRKIFMHALMPDEAQQLMVERLKSQKDVGDTAVTENPQQVKDGAAEGEGKRKRRAEGPPRQGSPEEKGVRRRYRIKGVRLGFDDTPPGALMHSVPAILEALHRFSAVAQEVLLLLPRSIRHIEVMQNMLPLSWKLDISCFEWLKSVSFGNPYDGSAILPPSLKKVTFGRLFNQADLVLPSSLEELVFSEDSVFNRPIALPSSLKKVTFGKCFNQADLVLPSSLEVLKFSSTSEFNRPICFPTSLRKVSFGNQFDQCRLALPSSLEELEFSDRSVFNRPIDLPSSLKKVTFGRYFDQADLVLPSSLEVLGFPPRSRFNRPILLPSSLKKVTFGIDLDQADLVLPSSLEVLAFPVDSRFNKPIDLPPSLKKANLGDVYNQPVTLPSSLEEASFGRNFNQVLDMPSPSSLKTLHLGLLFDQPIELTAPLQHVTFGASFSQRLPDELPASLLHVVLGRAYAQPLPPLPAGLKTLQVGKHAKLPRMHKGLIVIKRRSRVPGRRRRSKT